MSVSLDQQAIARAPEAAASRAANVQKVRSPGGIEAWLVEDYAVPLVALEFGFSGGAAQDPIGKAGAATMLSGLLDEGAGPLDSEAFQRALDDDAIELSFSADRDVLTGHMQTLSRNTARAFELLALAVQDARLDAEPLERVRGQLAAGLRHELNDPDAVAARLFRSLSYPEHPYGRPVRGTLDSLPQIARDDLVAMRAMTMSRDTLKLGVVGAIDAEALGRHLDDAFGALPASGDRQPIRSAVFAGVGGQHVTQLDIPQSTIRFGRQGLPRDDADFIAGTVVNHILGGGIFSARLFREVREKRGLAYSVYSQLIALDHGCMMTGSTSTKNERARESMDVIAAEIRGLAEDGPTDEELDKAKRYLIGSYALRFDTSTKIASQLMHLQLEGYDVGYLDERNARIAAVTMDDAKRTAKRVFGDGELLVSVAGRPDGF